MNRDWLTTGQVARLCGVTPDAVLKWIKKGKLPASRTTGGHYRVSRDAIEQLSPSRSASATEHLPPTGSLPVRCWEYFSRAGAPLDICRECLVYRARVERCFEIATLGVSVGHVRRLCREDCANCSFFRASHGIATAVLVITHDETLIHRLEMEADVSRIILSFARSGYEGAAIIERFHPALIVMDSALPEVNEGRLVDSVLRDERVPGVKVVVALRRGDRLPSGAESVAIIAAPFSAKQLEQIADEQVQPASAAAPRGV